MNNDKLPIAEATNVSKQQEVQDVQDVQETVNDSNIQFIIEEAERTLEIQTRNELMIEIYSRAKVVKYLSIIDMFFLVINFGISLANKNFFWLFIFLFPLCVFGYYGADKFKKKYILGYSFYLLLISVYYLCITIAYGYILSLIIYLIELYFLFYTLRLYKYLNIASDNVITLLRDGWNPNRIIYYFI